MLFGAELIWWGLIVAYMYRTAAFKSIPGLSRDQSNWLFWGIWSLCILAGILCTPKGKRGSLSVFASTGTPVAIYLMLSYFKLYKTTFSVALAATGAALFFYIILVVTVNWQDIRSGKFNGGLFRFFSGLAHKGRMIVCLGLSMIFLVFYLNLFFGAPLMDSTTLATDPKANDQKISNNKDTILLLQEEKWSTLSVQQRLEVLQTVANIEATYLGLPHELNVVIEAMDDITDGHYNDGTHTIAINPDHIAADSGEELVETVAHEAFHAYEHRLVDLYNSTGSTERNLMLFNRIAEYKDNFDNYIQGSEDIDGYRIQPVETDSVRYSISAVSDYFDAIDEYLNPEE